MNKHKLLVLLSKHGDCTLDIKGEHPIVCTTDFRNQYIKSKRRAYFADYKANVLVFSWTDDKHILIKPETVIRATPLSATLNNIREQ